MTAFAEILCVTRYVNKFILPAKTKETAWSQNVFLNYQNQSNQKQMLQILIMHSQNTAIL